MLKKTIRYKDFNGNEREEDFYFNLTPAEITEMEMRAKGGLQEVLGRIIKEQDTEQMIEYFKSIIRSSYGVKSTDGRNFTKNDRVWEEFSSTNAYSKLFMELATNDIAASNFIKAIMPSQAEIDEYTNSVTPTPATSNVSSFPSPQPKVTQPTYDEEAINALVEKRMAERMKQLENASALDILASQRAGQKAPDPSTIPNVIASNMGLPERLYE